MTRVIDTFLFFQELDLLEIRMKYLEDLVDYFIIVEAAQTFSGKMKPFIFEINRSRFTKFENKIVYVKIDDFHENYASVIQHLAIQRDDTSKKIKKILEAHNHYDKNHLPWVLDSYHRECIHYGLTQISREEDIVLLSDLDEIPKRKRVSDLKSKGLQHFIDLQQSEFRYFLNFHKDNKWLGTIAGRASDFYVKSLNELRVDSKSSRLWFKDKPITNGGYHFTSVGNIDMIRTKIHSWAHQEYNNSFTLSELEKNIRTGQDIFNRETGTTLKQVEIMTSDLFDQNIRQIISNYPTMISSKKIETIKFSSYKNIKRQIRKIIFRLIYELKTKVRFF